jgi:hypothetical protein
MKSKIVLGLVTVLALAGCGKSHSSSSGGDQNRFVSIQGICSQRTVELHRGLMELSRRGISNSTRLSEANNSCLSLRNELGDNACEVANQDHKLISYSDVANYCNDVQNYEGQGRTMPPPHPLPVAPSPNPSPVRPYEPVDGILLENVNTDYVFYFEKSTLDNDDMDVRLGQTRCQISMSDYVNTNLRNKSGKFLNMRVNSIAGDKTYSIVMSLIRSNELVRLTCHSHNQHMTVRDLNSVLDGVLELRLRR